MSSAKITEGGTPRNFTQVFKLKTDLQGGGTCLWVPEDERKLADKRFSENGSYTAEDEGYYGYSKVTVNVPNTGSVTGTDGNGNPISVSVDPETGDLVEKELPYSISITNPPTKTTYEEGEIIDYTGIVVTAYKKDGTVWEGEGYTGGVIPFNELVFPVAIAHADSQGYQSDVVTQDIIPEKIPASEYIPYYEYKQSPDKAAIYEARPCGVEEKFLNNGVGMIVNTGAKEQGERNLRCTYIIVSTNDVQGEIFSYNQYGQPYESYRTAIYDGRTVHFCMGTFTFNQMYLEKINGPYANALYTPVTTEMAGKIAWIIRYGTKSGEASVPVQWARPDDYTMLGDAFGIDVSESTAAWQGGE